MHRGDDDACPVADHLPHSSARALDYLARELWDIARSSGTADDSIRTDDPPVGDGRQKETDMAARFDPTEVRRMRQESRG